MGFSFFPKSAKFYDLFQAQNRKLVKAAGILNEIVQDFADVEEKCKQINIVESEGNAICRDIASQLSLTFITPLDREDIHAINLAQEDSLNLLKAIATRIGLYDLSRMKYPARKLANNLSLMIDETTGMICCLKPKNGFEKHLERLKALKYECETVLLVALGETYDTEEKTFETILDIVKWTHVYDRFEQAIVRVESLADILEGVMLKNA